MPFEKALVSETEIRFPTDVGRFFFSLARGWRICFMRQQSRVNYTFPKFIQPKKQFYFGILRVI